MFENNNLIYKHTILILKFYQVIDPIRVIGLFSFYTSPNLTSHSIMHHFLAYSTYSAFLILSLRQIYQIALLLSLSDSSILESNSFFFLFLSTIVCSLDI